LSPRTTAPKYTPVRGPIVTDPITVALGANHAVGSTDGLLPLNGIWTQRVREIRPDPLSVLNCA
jgi:hypothetical protein